MLLKPEELSHDVYLSENYVSLYVDPNRGEEVFKFEYREGKKKFFTISVKRPIPFLEGFYELETAYGYGGFIVTTCDEDFIRKAFGIYRDFCLSQNIVAEFVRFHPFNPYNEVVGKFLDFFKKDRLVVFVSLSKEKNYASSLKRNLKKAQSFNLRFEILKKTKENLKIFMKLYYKTMERHRANKFYFFPKSYFEKLFSLGEAKLFATKFEEKIVNAVVILESSNKVAYYHLGATHPEFYKYNVNPFIFDKLIDFYKEKNYRFFYLGGGTDSDPQNSLLRFKKKFSKEYGWFYIGGIIFNSRVYEFLRKNFCKSGKF
ncbi:MAG: hypothetical protein DSZ30_00410, partial [Aquificaceae bacterium]